MKALLLSLVAAHCVAAAPTSSGVRSHGAERKNGHSETQGMAEQTQKIAGKEDPILAYYDPPWTPVFLRRNEVMIRVEVTSGHR